MVLAKDLKKQFTCNYPLFETQRFSMGSVAVQTYWLTARGSSCKKLQCILLSTWGGQLASTLNVCFPSLSRLFLPVHFFLDCSGREATWFTGPRWPLSLTCRREGVCFTAYVVSAKLPSFGRYSYVTKTTYYSFSFLHFSFQWSINVSIIGPTRNVLLWVQSMNSTKGAYKRIPMRLF